MERSSPRSLWTRYWIYCLTVVGLAVGFGAGIRSAQADERERPNIVLILADDMGWTDAGCFGSDVYETPNIDRLAAAGIRFTNGYAACNVCSPTRAALMTGKYPARLHLTDYIPGGRDRGMRSPEWTKFLPLEEVTIAEALGSAGYVCGHFGKWHLNRDKNYRPNRPLDPASQGFHDVLTTVKPKRDADPDDDPHHAFEITARAISFIEKNQSRPFFCYVSHNSLHRPVIARRELLQRYAERIGRHSHQRNAMYAAMVHDLDQTVGQITAKLDDLGIAEKTLVVFTSDNGGFLGDEQEPGTSCYPLRGGKGTNYEGGVRVPTIVRWPGVTPPGSTCETPICTPDYLPTLLQAAGVVPGDVGIGEIDGQSIVPLLRDPAASFERDTLYWHYPHYHALGATPHGAIRSGDWKLIEFYEDGHVELYNLKQDIGEENDLASKMPEKADELRRRLHEWREKVGAQMPIEAGASG